MFALLLQSGPNPDLFVPLIGIVGGTLMFISVVFGIAYVRVHAKEAERDMVARRLAYEQRMKELEIEKMRLELQQRDLAVHDRVAGA
jgi:cell division protein FtsL